MNIEQNRILELVNQFNEAYSTAWQHIIEPNQANINLETDFEYKKQLQQQHDLLCTLINKQFDTFNALAAIAIKLPGKNELTWQKEYCRQLKAYIKALGGNPSNVNFTLKNDY